MLKSPPIARNLSRYNSRDRQLLSTHLSEFLSTCSDLQSGGPHVHCIDTRHSSRSPSDDPRDATRPEIKIKEKILSYTEKKMKASRVYKVS